MCGRYSLDARPQQIAEAFALAEAIELEPRYNIAPTQSVPVVRLDQASRCRRLDMIRWGLARLRSKDSRPIINARSETVAERPAFRLAFRCRRCLVPATGFYEWQKLGGAKQPFQIRRRDRALFALAGIWDRCPDGSGGVIEAFAVLTTTPNGTVAPIHDRMPVVLEPSAYSLWLDPDLESAASLRPLLGPLPDDRLIAYPISDRVNSADHDDAACVEPLAER